LIPQHLIIDYLTLPECDIPQTALVRGDVSVLSIACASIVAKVARDRWMVGLEQQHPGYGFDRHKGYGTAFHRKALKRLGPSPFHRMSYAPVAASGCLQTTGSA
jgi:ribonuclease HII